MIWLVALLVVGIGGPLGVLVVMWGRVQQWRNTPLPARAIPQVLATAAHEA